MEARNLDFEIEVTRDQWDELGRTAAALGPEQGGLDWRENEPDEIRVFLRDEDAPGRWRDFVTDEDVYGAHEREIARFRFNDGRPFADVDDPVRWIEEPAFSEVEQHGMRRDIERFVRTRWHDLMRASGLHYDRGHIPQS